MLLVAVTASVRTAALAYHCLRAAHATTSACAFYRYSSIPSCTDLTSGDATEARDVHQRKTNATIRHVSSD